MTFKSSMKSKKIRHSVPDAVSGIRKSAGGYLYSKEKHSSSYSDEEIIDLEVKRALKITSFIKRNRDQLNRLEGDRCFNLLKACYGLPLWCGLLQFEMKVDDDIEIAVYRVVKDAVNAVVDERKRRRCT